MPGSLIHLSAAAECLLLGVGIQRAGRHAKCVIRALLKGSTTRVRRTQITLVQLSGVACSFIRTLMYTLAVVLFQTSREPRSGWQYSLIVLLFYFIVDLLPLSVFLWLVRGSRTQDDGLLTHSSSTAFSEAKQMLKNS